MFFVAIESRAQCELFDGNGVMNANPEWVSCNGADFTLFIQSNTTFGAYTIDWGDGSPVTAGVGLAPPNFVSHVYTAAIANYTLTFTEPGTGCVVIGLVVMEEPVNASIQIPIGGVTQVCAPDLIEFLNSSTDVSANVVFTWDFGDGSPIETYGDTNAGQTIGHTYQQNTVNCVTAVTLTAENYCSFGNPTTAVFNPIQVFDIDDAQVTASEELLCYPDTVVHFDNTTNRNCVPQGNTVQRFEYWNFGDYWGVGSDSIIDWQPFLPPNRPGYDIAYPGLGTYDVMMIDSNQCGQDTAYVTIQIVDQPTAALTSDKDTVCTGEVVTFFNNSFGGSNQHRINYGDGTGWININASNTKTYNTAGTYTILLAANINGGSASCTDTTSIDVEVLASPIVNFTVSPASACDSLTVSFTNTSTGGTQYAWDFDNGNTSTQATPPSEFYGSSGAYTVELTVTSNNGCVSDDTENVNVFDSPVAGFTAQNVCEDELATFIDNSTTGFGGGITSRLWSFGDVGSTTSNLQNPQFTYVDSGTFVISLAVTTANCTDTISDTISVEPTPISAFAMSDSVGCSPLDVTFTDGSTGAVNFFWDFGDGSTSSLQNPNHVFLHTGLTDTTFVVKLLSSSAFGCADSSFDTVTVQGNPDAAFSSDAFLDCAPLEVQFSDSTTGATSLAWDFGDGTGSVLNNPLHTFQNTTQFISNYTVQLVATAANGCTDTATDAVTVYPEPLFNFNIVPDSGCSPLFVQFPVAVGAVVYQWDFGDGGTATGPSPSHTFVNNTTNDLSYTVQLIATSPFGCVDTVEGDVLVFPNPTAVLAPLTAEGCEPLTVNFVNSSTGATTFAWDFDNGNTSSTAATNVSHIYSNSTSDTLFFDANLVAITDRGCVDTAFSEVTVYRRIEASFSVPTDTCHPFTTALTDLSTNPFTWDWDFDDGGTSTLQNPQHTFQNTTLVPVTFDVNLEVENVEGCADDTTISTVVFPKPTADFTLSDTVGCEPLAVTITNNSVLNQQNFWDFGDGTTSTTAANSINIVYPNPTNLPINRTIELMVENQYGCRDTASSDVEVHSQIFASFAVPTAGCHPFPVLFSDSSVNASQYAWDFDDGGVSTISGPAHTFQNFGTTVLTFDATLTVTNDQGCTDDSTIIITVFPKPTADFTLSDTVGCEPLAVTITNNSVLNQQNFWDFGDGTTSTSAANTINIVYPNPTNLPINRTIELMIENQFGCRDTTSSDVDVHSQIFASFAVPTVGCHPFTVSFSDSSVNASQYAWDFDDGAVSTVSGPTHTFQNPGTTVLTFDVTLTVTNAQGCTDDSTVTITVYPKPTAAFALSDTVGCEPLVVNFTNNSTLNLLNFWDLGDGTTSTSNVTNFSHTYPNPTNNPVIRLVELKVENQFGCRDSIQRDVEVHSQIHADFSVPAVGCHPYSAVFTNLSTNAVQYDWDFDDGNFSSFPAPTHQFINATNTTQTFDVSLTVTNAQGCTDVMVQTVTVNPKPTAGFQISTNLGCEPLVVTFTNVSVISDSNHWNFDNGQVLVSNANTVQTTYTNPTNFAALFNPALIVTTQFGCMDTFTTQIEVHPQIIAGFDVDTMGCHPFNTQFIDQSVNAAQYAYTFGDLTAGSVQASPAHQYNNFSTVPETFTATQTVTNTEGCQAVQAVTIDVYPKPVSQFAIVSTPSCHAEPMSFLNQSSLNIQNYWTIGANGFPAIENSSQLDTVFYNFTSNPRQFPVTLVVESAFGCLDTSNSSVTIYPEVDALFTVPDEGCAPFEANFTNLSSGGNLFFWDFGDGNQSFLQEPLHTFENTGTTDITYDVKLTVTSPFNCTDTHTISVLVRPAPDVLFTATPTTQRFPASTITLNNLTNPGPWDFNWEFGEGTTAIGPQPGVHVYDTWGTYTVLLTGSTPFCQDTHTQMVVIEPPFPIALFEIDTQGCAPVTIDLVNQSEFGVSYLWDFGDGAKSSAENPTYTYSFPGTYNVKLTVTGPGGDTDEEVIIGAITVYQQPTANFVFTPEQVTVPSEPVNFINYSQFGESFLWDFGDTVTSTEENPQHFYKISGTFFPSLTVSNSFGCTDSMVSLIPLTANETGNIQVPNAFTPSPTGGTGGFYDPFAFDNQVFFPIVAGVREESFLLSIYNRWGELIFETDELSQGWDGYYLGQICQQDVYVWKMKGEFINGTKFTKVGDVTLLR